MKVSTAFYQIIGAVIIIASLISSCSKGTQPVMITESPKPIVTNTTALLESSPTISPISLSTSSQDSFAIPKHIQVTPAPKTPTVNPSPSTALITLTSTPQPILESSDAEKLAMHLLETNSDCLLPCWWGFSPGITLWDDAKIFLEQFDSEIYIPFSPEEPVLFAEVRIPVPKKIYYRDLPQTYYMRDGIIEAMEMIPGNTTRYRLSNFLETYGPPGEIWLLTYSSEYPVGEVLPFMAVLFYPDRGILAVYGPDQAYFTGDKVRACQWGDPPNHFGLWSPKQELTFSEAARLFRFPLDDPGFLMLPIEEATKIDAQTFYELFKDPGSGACLETPKNLWPSQF